MDGTAQATPLGARSRWSLRSAAAGMLVGVLSLGVFVAAARLDPDPHHDGVVLAPAIGAAEGLRIHSELFSQYGPMTTWLQIPAIWLGGPDLLSIRLHAALALSLTAVMVAFLTRRLTRSDAAGVLAAGVWVAECQDWAIVGHEAFPLWPWPSVYCALLVLLSTAALLGAVAARSRHALLLSSVSGALVGAACFTRLQLGIIHAVMTTMVLLVAWAVAARRDSRGWAGNALTGYVLGFLLSIAVVLGGLASRGSLGAFVSQAVVGPLNEYGSGIDVMSLFMSLAFVPALLCALICMALVLVRVRGRSRLLVLLTVLAVSLVLAAVVFRGADSWHRQIAPGQVWITLAPAASGLLVFRAIWPTPLRIPTDLPAIQARTRLAIVGIGGVAAWAQFVPLGDAAHVWWAAPLPMVALATLFFEVAAPSGRLVLAGLACLAIALGAVLFFREVSAPRTELHGGALEGMLVRDELLPGWLAMQAFLDRHELAGADYVTADGLFAVWSGEYAPRDGAYVAWSWGLDALAPAGREVLYCERDLGAAGPWAESQGGQVVDSSGQVGLFPAPWGWQTCAWVERTPAG